MTCNISIIFDGLRERRLVVWDGTCTGNGLESEYHEGINIAAVRLPVEVGGLRRKERLAMSEGVVPHKPTRPKYWLCFGQRSWI